MYLHHSFLFFRDQCLKNIRFVKQDPIIIQTPRDLNPEHVYISALTAKPSGRILVVIHWRDYTCIKMFDIEGKHLSDLEVPPVKHDVATANDEEAILLLSEQSKVLILDIRTNKLSV